MCTIILYGRSLVLDALESRLRQAKQGEVMRFTDTLEVTWLTQLPPGLLIYDHAQTDASTLHRLLQHSAGWALIGLTDAGDLLVTRRQSGAALADVLALVQAETAAIGTPKEVA